MLRPAVIGVGHLGTQHARIHATLAAEGLCEFAAVCDLDETRAQKVATQRNTRSTADWRSLIGQVDAVSLAVPTESHCEIACELLTAGIHVLVENRSHAAEEPTDIASAQEEKRAAKGHANDKNGVVGGPLFASRLFRNPASVSSRPSTRHRCRLRFNDSRSGHRQ